MWRKARRGPITTLDGYVYAERTRPLEEHRQQVLLQYGKLTMRDVLFPLAPGALDHDIYIENRRPGDTSHRRQETSGDTQGLGEGVGKV